MNSDTLREVLANKDAQAEALEAARVICQQAREDTRRELQKRVVPMTIIAINPAQGFTPWIKP